jgi:hypothetical protein
VYHLVESAEEIPAQYRRQAGRILGSIQHADAVPITYRPPSFAQPSVPVRRPAAPAAPAPSQPAVFRNELGENFLQYNERLREQALYPKTEFNAKCIDNSGEQVPCSQTRMQSHR